MALVLELGPMVNAMRVNGKMIKEMVKELPYTLMENAMKVNGKMINDMAKE